MSSQSISKTLYLSLALLGLAGGCASLPAPTVEEVSIGARSAKTRPRSTRDPDAGGALTGRAELPLGVLARAGDLVSDRGYGVIANNGGAVVSNQGGQVIANNGGAFRAPYGLLATGQRALVGFPVRIVDAAGAPVLDQAGRPYETTTDRLGRYAFRHAPRGRNHLVVVELPGELGRMVALLADAAPGVPREADVEGVGTHVVGYVLANFVKADQARLDRLSGDLEAQARAEAEEALAAVAGGKLEVESVEEEALVKTVGVWRELSAEFDAKISEIEQAVGG